MAFTWDDYTVAWICALPLEMTAAKAILDTLHPPQPQSQSDHNVYTLGSVGGNNIVIACLPTGVYGVTSATVVLAHTQLTFPSGQFGLMVGIGGGVSSKSSDIRLGDVAISMLPNGFGSLNKPPQNLLTAISQVRSENMLREANTKKPRERFSRPDHDLLFKSTYDHESRDLDCSACDQSQLGPFMKDARMRDSIAQQLGIHCFEMEAAGLIDQLPCLVIRGICDYCDSHKQAMVPPYSHNRNNNVAEARRMVPFSRNV
ncbi:nucleoside phosphorylase domain-containing protein [Aspergillus granulosus]|uniref:Nucleoside phosphorylase domain-containing protein n=1 Tax=Aspergillus granulosus TaxID=176169 RepID=A0ABR4GU69_9EURO